MRERGGRLFMQSYTLSHGEYLSSLDIPTDERYMMVVSDTGTGKTTWALETFTKFDMVFPTISICEQKGKEHGIHYVMSGVYPNTDEKQFGTFDAIYKFRERDCSDRTLIIDESHHYILSTSENYRRNTLNALFDAIPEYKQVILLTGTPIITAHPLLATFSVHHVDYQDRISQKYTFIFHDDILATIESKLIPDRINIVVCNDKSAIDKYRRYFEHHQYVCGVCTSETRSQSPITDIIHTKYIPDRYDIIFTTSVISEGVDIYNDNIGTLQIVTESSPALIKQFISRFRYHNPKTYIYIQRQQDPSYTIDILAEEKKLHDRAEQKISFFNELLQEDMISNEHIVNAIRYDLKSEFTYMYRIVDNEYEVDHTGIAHYIYEIFSHALYKNTREFEKALLYYQLHCENTEISTIKLYTEDLSVYQQQKEERAQELEVAYQQELQLYTSMSSDALADAAKYSDLAKNLQQLHEEYGIVRDQSIQYLSCIGRSRQKYNQLCRRLRIQQYYHHEATDIEGTIDRIIQAFHIQERYTSSEICATLTGIFMKSQYYSSELSEAKSIRILRDFFEITRTKKKSGTRYINAYLIHSNNPLCEYLS